LSGSDSNVLRHNVSTANGEGYVIEASSGTMLVSNISSGNGNTGYWTREGSAGTILRHNSARANTFGIVFWDSASCVLDSNRASLLRSDGNELSSNTTNLNGTFGIVLSMSNGNVLRANPSNRNEWVGIKLQDGSSNNSVLKNVARMNGIVDAADDLSGTGNFWSDTNFGNGMPSNSTTGRPTSNRSDDALTSTASRLPVRVT